MHLTAQPVRLGYRLPLFSLVIALLATTLSGCKPPDQVFEGEVVFENKPVFPGSVIAVAENGETYSANLTAEGKFIFTAIPPGSYKISIQTQQLANLGTFQAPSAKATGGEKRREATVPEKFKSANVAIPDRYRESAKSGLNMTVPNETEANTPIRFELTR